LKKTKIEKIDGKRINRYEFVAKLAKISKYIELDLSFKFSFSGITIIFVQGIYH